MNTESEIKPFDMESVARGARMTTWSNDTPDEQVVRVQVPKRVRIANKETGQVTEYDANEDRSFLWAPGQTREVPSMYDIAIHCVRGCNHGLPCREAYCLRPGDAGPKAVCVGGAAPLLRRAGQRYQIDPALTAHLQPSAPASIAEPAAEGASAEDGVIARARARRGAR